MNIILHGGPADGQHMTAPDGMEFVEVPVDPHYTPDSPLRRIFAAARYERTDQERDGLVVYEWAEKPKKER